MSKLPRILAATAILAALVPADPVRADGYVEWLNRCSTGSLVTCASARLTVSGTFVTLQVWNVSSGSTASSASGYASSVFHMVGLRSLPSAVVASPSWVNMTGPYASSGRKLPANWTIPGTNGDGTGINLQNASGTSMGGGIASNCGASAMPSRTPVFMNPTCGATGVTNSLENEGWVNITFQVSQTWDPLASNTELVVKAIDEQNRLYELNAGAGAGGGAEAMPEPASMILLGTGLMGMAGVAARRRRREAEAAGLEA